MIFNKRKYFLYSFFFLTRETYNFSYFYSCDYQLSRNIKAKLHRVDNDNGNHSHVDIVECSHQIFEISPKCQMNNIEP